MSYMCYVRVQENENSEPIEIPSENDGSIAVSSLSEYFDGATGLTYKVNGINRAVKLNGGKLYPPPEGWGSLTYYCVFPNDRKRKVDDEMNGTTESISFKENDELNSDLVVLGLPWKTTDETLREYFSTFGELEICQVKFHPGTSKSKGFGFIRYKDKESQVRVMLQRHEVDGRLCDVRIPYSKDGTRKAPLKIFVAQCTEDLTSDVLREYFEQFGKTSDVYVPNPHRGFAFVTFFKSDGAKLALHQPTHKIKDTNVVVTEAVPKEEKQMQRTGRLNDYGGMRGGSYSFDPYEGYGGGRPGKKPRGGGGGGRREDSMWDRPRSSSAWADDIDYYGWNVPYGKSRGGKDASFDHSMLNEVVSKTVMSVIGNLKK